MIEPGDPRLSVMWQCELVLISRSGFYHRARVRWFWPKSSIQVVVPCCLQGQVGRRGSNPQMILLKPALAQEKVR